MLLLVIIISVITLVLYALLGSNSVFFILSISSLLLFILGFIFVKKRKLPQEKASNSNQTQPNINAQKRKSLADQKKMKLIEDLEAEADIDTFLIANRYDEEQDRERENDIATDLYSENESSFSADDCSDDDSSDDDYDD